MNTFAPDPLDTWLRDSINRGCTLESMVESMITSGHAENLALLIVTAAFARFKPEALDLAQERVTVKKHCAFFPAARRSRSAGDVAQPRRRRRNRPRRRRNSTTSFLDPVGIEGNVIHLSDRDIKVSWCARRRELRSSTMCCQTPNAMP
jgi:hypothetical protein